MSGIVTDTSTPTPTPAAPNRPRGRPVWLTLGLVLLVAGVAWGAYTLADLMGRRIEHSAFTVSASTFPAGGLRVLDIHADGKVQIVGGDAPEVRVTVREERGLQKPSVSHRLSGSTLELRGTCPGISSFCSVGFTVTVPRSVAVQASSSGGSVSVTRVDGPVQLSSSGGSVRAIETTGDVRMSSSGGGVTGEALRSGVVKASSSGGGVKLAFVQPPRSVDASSSGGGVRVQLPRGADTYAVDASSSGGGTSVDVRTDPQSAHRVRVRSSGGGVTVEYGSPAPA